MTHFSGNLCEYPKSWENLKCTESPCPWISVAPGYRSDMSLKHRITACLPQEPQRLANKSLKACKLNAIHPAAAHC